MSRLVRRAALIVIALLMAYAAYLGWLQISGNFHAVIPGEVYRSAQMDGAQLARWTQQHKIASVLNLRGEDDDAPWYREEVEAADRLGLSHIDFRMSASRALDQDEVRRLMAVMRDAPKPLLIHCKAGSDRTGLAAALYKAMAGAGEAEAAAQLSIVYGHVALPVSDAWPMDLTWEAVRPMLGYAP